MELSPLHFIAIYVIGFFVSLMVFTWWIGYLYAKGENSSFWSMYMKNTLFPPGTLDFYQMRNLSTKIFLSAIWFLWWPVSALYILAIVPLFRFTSFVLDKVSHLGFIMGSMNSAKSLTEPHPIESKEEVIGSTEKELRNSSGG